VTSSSLRPVHEQLRPPCADFSSAHSPFDLRILVYSDARYLYRHHVGHVVTRIFRNIAFFSTDSQRVICIIPAQTSGNMAALRCRMEHCSICVFRVPALTPLCMLHGHTDNVMWVPDSPFGTLIASTSWDGTVRLWSATDGRALRTLTSPEHQHQL
jgi:WD40 repeat protein